MNKRLRKKKHKGEFNHKGFNVEAKFTRTLTPEEVDAFCDSFLEFVEGLDLGGGGGFNQTGFGMYMGKHPPRRSRNGRYKFSWAHCTEDDREKVAAWLAANDLVTSIEVGQLEPGWT